MAHCTATCVVTVGAGRVGGGDDLLEQPPSASELEPRVRLTVT